MILNRTFDLEAVRGSGEKGVWILRSRDRILGSLDLLVLGWEGVAQESATGDVQEVSRTHRVLTGDQVHGPRRQASTGLHLQENCQWPVVRWTPSLSPLLERGGPASSEGRNLRFAGRGTTSGTRGLEGPEDLWGP